ncbi:GntR family transcriptional regulator [Streptomyces mangrovisoli]|uniref:GntR family transcriptional regulator n=1 Tax=Streptomyces mangrovisoli TaxID=1428628 RepID=A0A1J4P133_9ACTN|nr:GntR family transcriptional regulator [Streptomyces mangrovisoli]OIJ68471.1 GntR family transcriptional regulator [Streptomyces mangrovisoli]
MVRQQILRGEFAPQQRLHEPFLAELHHVTRASVRAALIDLAGEGLVERTLHRGSRVRVVPVAEAVEIIECRIALEALCARKAALAAGTREREELVSLGTEMTRAVGAGDVGRYAELNQQLHQRVIDLSGHEIARDMLARLNAQLVRHEYQLALRPGGPKKSLGEQLAIVDAIAAGDPAAAENAICEHLRSVMRDLSGPA